VHKIGEVKEDEMGRACSMHSEEERIYYFGGKAGRKEITRKTQTLMGG
jgi:hypothetical protein